jgi:hypothetical protein
MPVTWGMSKKGVDFHCAVKGPHGYAMAFYIEAKRPGEEATALQEDFMKSRLEEQGASWFVIDNEEDIVQLTMWLAANERSRADNTVHIPH